MCDPKGLLGDSAACVTPRVYSGNKPFKVQGRAEPRAWETMALTRGGSRGGTVNRTRQRREWEDFNKNDTIWEPMGETVEGKWSHGPKGHPGLGESQGGV